MPNLVQNNIPASQNHQKPFFDEQAHDILRVVCVIVAVVGLFFLSMGMGPVGFCLLGIGILSLIGLETKKIIRKFASEIQFGLKLAHDWIIEQIKIINQAGMNRKGCSVIPSCNIPPQMIGSSHTIQ